MRDELISIVLRIQNPNIILPALVLLARRAATKRGVRFCGTLVCPRARPWGAKPGCKTSVASRTASNGR